MVDSRFSWGVTRVPPRLFSKQINMLLEMEKNFLTISDYINQNPSDRRNSIAITFDDGYESVYLHAFPILQELGIKASVFINPGFVGQYNTWDANFGKRSRHLNWRQIEELNKAGWEMGSHGMKHHDLTRLSLKQLDYELRQSQKIICRRIGSCSSVFSFPFGNYDEHVWSQCLQAGCTKAVTMGGKTFLSEENRITGRLGVYAFDSAAILKNKINSHKSAFVRWKQKLFDVCSNLTVFFKSKSWQVDQN